MHLQPRHLLAALLLLTLPLAVSADDPNIQPGEWSYTTTTRMLNAPFPFPEQTHTSTECVTLEDIKRGDAFLDDVEECTVNEMEIGRDSMHYTMVCRAEDGTEFRMRSAMRFHGDRLDGTMESEIETPMGPMQMQITLEGRRTGDC